MADAGAVGSLFSAQALEFRLLPSSTFIVMDDVVFVRTLFIHLPPRSGAKLPPQKPPIIRSNLSPSQVFARPGRASLVFLLHSNMRRLGIIVLVT